MAFVAFHRQVGFLEVHSPLVTGRLEGFVVQTEQAVVVLQAQPKQPSQLITKQVHSS
jgi:hypothetical protein